MKDSAPPARPSRRYRPPDDPRLPHFSSYEEELGMAGLDAPTCVAGGTMPSVRTVASRRLAALHWKGDAVELGTW